MTDFEAFSRGNLRLGYAVSLTLTREMEKAQDLTQETFLRAWRHRDLVARLSPPARSGSYAFRAANSFPSANDA